MTDRKAQVTHLQGCGTFPARLEFLQKQPQGLSPQEKRLQDGQFSHPHLQHPIQLHQIQHPVEPHLLTGIMQESLNYSRETMGKMKMGSSGKMKSNFAIQEDQVGHQETGVVIEKPRDLNAVSRELQGDTRDLIFSAISVMKNRKARPDVKRITTWINRRYGRPIHVVTEELNKLVQVGDLTRVDYKGSASFRIVSPFGKQRRKRKVMKNGPNSDGEGSATGRDAGAAAPKISLHILVMDLLGEPKHTADTLPVNRQTIEAAVKSSSRDFARPYVLENLEHLLAQEVECGNFVKLDAENYWIVCKPAVRPPSVNIRLAPPRSFPALPQHPVSPVSIHQRPTGCSQSVAHLLPTLPTSPVPSHQMPQPLQTSLPMPLHLNVPRPMYNFSPPHTINGPRLQIRQVKPFGREVSTPTPQNVNQIILQNYSYPLPTTPIPQNTSGGTTFSFLQSQIIPNPPTQPLQCNFQMPQLFTQQQSLDINIEKSDDEIKNNLIRCQLSKICSPGKKFPDQVLRRPDTQSNFDDLEMLKAFRKRKFEVHSVSESFEEIHGLQRRDFSTSGKFCQTMKNSVITDIQSPVSNHFGRFSSSTELIITEPSTQKTCVVCNRNSAGFPQKVSNQFLTCKSCIQSSHTSCLKLSEDLALKMTQQSWLCNNCRQCPVCQKLLKSAVSVSCKSCDLGVHLNCLGNQNSSIVDPSCEWECQTCVSARLLQTRQPQLTVSVVRNGSRHIRDPLLQSLLEEKCPALQEPPSSHLEILKNWNDFEAEESVPDISTWTPQQLSSFFGERGFPSDVCRKFVDLEIDGCAALIMRRIDIIDGMGLRLGKALHIYNYIKKFQLSQCLQIVQGSSGTEFF